MPGTHISYPDCTARGARISWMLGETVVMGLVCSRPALCQPGHCTPAGTLCIGPSWRRSFRDGVGKPPLCTLYEGTASWATHWAQPPCP